MKKILLSLTLIAFAGVALYVGGTGAFFSDTESSLGNTFAAGAIDLKIDNESYYNGVLNLGTTWELIDLTIEKFFDFDDLKPGDWGEDTISLHVDTNDAYICADVTLTSNDDNGINEPEGLDGDTTDGDGEGELADTVNFLWWADDGDNVLEDDEDVISQGPIGALTLGVPYPFALADSDENIWTGVGGPVPGNETLYIGKAWCFGDIAAEPLEQDGLGAESPRTPANSTGGIGCDGSGLDNITQTDSLTADISFSAVQSRHNDGFQCDEPDDEIFACEVPTLAYADSVVDSNQGVRKNGTAVNLDRSDPSDALGAPQSLGLPFDNPVPTGEFFSLGFDEGEDDTALEGGWIVVEFTDNIIVDGPGNDLRVWEITGGTSYPVEKVKIEVSQDGSTWFEVSPSLDRDAEADLADSGLPWAKYVRLTDVSVRDEYEDTADGYDLDAFSALNCGVLEVEELIEEEDVEDPPTSEEPVALFSDGFGTGNSDTDFDEEPTWVEGGGGASKRNSAGGGDESISDGDGGRKAAMFGHDGYICKSVDATGYTDLNLGYQWRGDSDAEVGDNGLVQYATGGTCEAPIGLTTLATHPLTTTTWQSGNVSLGVVDNTSFLLYFKAASTALDEDFRVDAVELTGVPI